MFQSICFSVNNYNKNTNKNTNKSATHIIMTKNKESKTVKNETSNKKWWMNDDLILNLLITTLN